MSASTDDAARTRTMLLARARGRQDALEEEWGQRPERPARAANRDGTDGPVPMDVGAFARDAYQWRVDVVVTDGDGRVLLVPDGDGWTLPGGPGARTETVADAAARHAACAARGDVELRDLLWTQLVEFDYGVVDLPALRVVYAADAAAAAENVAGEWFAPDELPDFADADADALVDCLR